MWDLIPGPTALGAQNLNQWTTREVPAGRFLITVVPGKSSCCFDYGSFVVFSEVGRVMPSALFFFQKIALAVLVFLNCFIIYKL